MIQILHILLLFANEQDSDDLAHLLSANGYQVTLERINNLLSIEPSVLGRPWNLILIYECIPDQMVTPSIMNLLQQQGSSVPVVVLFDQPDEDRITAALKAGASRFLLKPNIHQKLPDIVKHALEKWTLESQQNHIAQFTPNILDAFLQESLDVIWAKDRNGRYLLINQAGSSFLGKPMDEVIGKDDLAVFSSETAQRIRTSDQQVMLTGQTQFFEDQLITRDGNKRVYLAMKAPFRDTDGNIQGIVGIIRDITQRKQAEEALRESEEKYKSLYSWEKSARETAHILYQYPEHTQAFPRLVETVGCLLKADRCFMIHYQNPKQNEYQGFEYVRRPATPAFTSLTPVDEVVSAFEQIVKSASACQPIVRIDNIETAAFSNNILQVLKLHQAKAFVAIPIVYRNEILALLVLETFTPRTWNEHETFFLHTVATQIAITLYQNKSIRELEQATLYKSMFLANISHEFRTPLNAIIGYSDMMHLEMAGPLSEKQKVYLNHIRTSGRHLLNLINDILDLSKIEYGKINLLYETVNVQQIIAEAIATLNPMAVQKSICLDFQAPSEIIYAEVDPVRLKQILYNLLSNAIKFTDDCGTVTVRIYQDLDNSLIITITDTGIGIAKEDYHRIFSEFEQLDNSYSRRQSGTGLGLALTRKLVEAHGGKIAFTSQLGEGTTFVITLPCSQKSSLNAHADSKAGLVQ